MKNPVCEQIQATKVKPGWARCRMRSASVAMSTRLAGFWGVADRSTTSGRNAMKRMAWLVSGSWRNCECRPRSGGLRQRESQRGSVRPGGSDKKTTGRSVRSIPPVTQMCPSNSDPTHPRACWICS